MTLNETSSEATFDNVIVLRSLGGRERIELQGDMIVGRGTTCDVLIEEERLSRKHAKLSLGDGVVLVEDLGSLNGTFVNDNKADKPLVAKHNDIIRFDTFAYQVFVDVDDAATAFGESVPSEETVEAKTKGFAPPKSWALDDNQSSEGTEFMSVDMLSKPPVETSEHSGGVNGIATDVPVLVCLSGDMNGKVFKLGTRDALSTWEIGRADDCDICLTDNSVSSHHAQLVHDGKRWKLTDLMSANGTFVNGNKGLASYLSSGDKVRFGQAEFLFKLSDTEQTAVAAAHSVQGATLTPWIIGAAAFLSAAAILYVVFV